VRSASNYVSHTPLTGRVLVPKKSAHVLGGWLVEKHHAAVWIRWM